MKKAGWDMDEDQRRIKGKERGLIKVGGRQLHGISLSAISSPRPVIVILSPFLY